MEKEIADLRRRLAQQSSSVRPKSSTTTKNLYPGASAYASTVPIDEWNGSHEAVAGLLDLRSGVDSSTGYTRSPSGPLATSKRIEDVVVGNERVVELFQRQEVVLTAPVNIFLTRALQVLRSVSSILSLP
jgi:hypothetical protein